MNIKFLFSTLMFLFLLTGCFYNNNQKNSDSKLANEEIFGTYINTTNPNDYLILNSDKSYKNVIIQHNDTLFREEGSFKLMALGNKGEISVCYQYEIIDCRQLVKSLHTMFAAFKTGIYFKSNIPDGINL